MTDTTTVCLLRQRMIDDMTARKLGRHSQRSHDRALASGLRPSCKRSPETATADDVRRFQLHLDRRRAHHCTRNRTMTGVRFLFRVTMRRHDLAAEIYHLKEPQKVPVVLSSARPSAFW